MGRPRAALRIAAALLLSLAAAVAAPPRVAVAADAAPSRVCVRVVNSSGYVLGVERMSGEWEDVSTHTVLKDGQAVAACAVRRKAGEPDPYHGEADLQWGSPLGVRIALVVRFGDPVQVFATPPHTPVFGARVARRPDAPGASIAAGTTPSAGFECVFTRAYGTNDTTSH